MNSFCSLRGLGSTVLDTRREDLGTKEKRASLEYFILWEESLLHLKKPKYSLEEVGFASKFRYDQTPEDGG